MKTLNIVMSLLKVMSIMIFWLCIGFISCHKDDKEDKKELNTTASQIKLLTGKKKLMIEESYVICDGVRTIVFDFDIEDRNGQNWLALFLNENDDFISFTIKGDDIVGDSVMAKLDGSSYAGRNFKVNEKSKQLIELSGSLNSEKGKVKLVFIKLYRTSMGAGTSKITVNGNVAVLNGTLGALTWNQILDLNTNHKNVHTILFEDVPGSVNDTINVKTGRLIREAGYTTEIKAGGEIASGGVDLFCAGKKRIIGGDSKIGVHSWCCGKNGEQASDIPVNDPQHTVFIEYLNEMLGPTIGKDFYFFTINAASSSSIHWMDNKEIEKYMLKSN